MSEAEITPREAAPLAQPGLASVDSLIKAALDSGAPIEAIGRLIEMQERVQANEARGAFHNAVAELHARIGSIPKNKTAHFKTKSGASVSYRYADLHQIATHLRKFTGDLGLSWRWTTESAGDSVTVTCIASHRLGHSERSSWRAPKEQGNPMTSAPQKEKIATTFAQRVTLIQVFGLTDTDDDVDGQLPYDDGPRSAPQAVATITADQAANLSALCDEVGEPHVTNLLKWAGIERVEDLPAARYGQAVRALESKR